jgi:hypothetical protein
MLGGLVLAQFAAGELDPKGKYDIVIIDAGKEILRTTMDLVRMR